MSFIFFLNNQTFPFGEVWKIWCNVIAVVTITLSYLTLCQPLDCSPSGSSVHVILQARILQWVAEVLPTQELNQGLLHHRQILYQLSYLRSSWWNVSTIKWWNVPTTSFVQASLVAQVVNDLPAMQENLGFIPGLGRSPGEGNGYSL